MLRISKEVGKVDSIKYAQQNLKIVEPGEGAGMAEVEHYELCGRLLKKALSSVTFSVVNVPMALPCTLIEHIQGEFSYDKLKEIFQEEFAKIYKVERDQPGGLTSFQKVCMTGLATLKTQHCRETDKSQMFKPAQTGHLFGEQNCPVCSEVFAKLRHKVPNAHIVHSRLLDPISGEPIQDNPIMLPSTRHIYSLQTINTLLCDQKQTNSVTCPLTGAKIDRGLLERIFIMG